MLKKYDKFKKTIPSFFYGLNKNFRVEIDEKINKEISHQIEENWLSDHGIRDLWIYDYDSNEIKGSLYPKEIARYLDSSTELEEKVAKTNIDDIWRSFYSLSDQEILRKKENNRKKIEEYGNQYYCILDKIPCKISKLCEIELGKSIASKKFTAQLFLTNPFHTHRDKDFELGLIIRGGLLYGLLVQLSLISLLTLNNPVKFLIHMVLAGKKYKRIKHKLFSQVKIISKKMARGESGLDSIPSLKHLFGEKVVDKLSDELNELQQIRQNASPFYIEYLLLQIFTMGDNVNSFVFDSEGKMPTKLNNKEIDKNGAIFTSYEMEVLKGLHDSSSQTKESTFFHFLLEWLDENKFWPGMEKKIKKDVLYKFKKEIVKTTSKTYENKMKVIADADDMAAVSTWILDISKRLNKQN